VRDLAARIEKHDARDFETVVPAFLEFAQPDIGAGVDHYVKPAAKKITVLPYIEPES
jgi:sirohydrochlorin ferrochelatase